MTRDVSGFGRPGEPSLSEFVGLISGPAHVVNAGTSVSHAQPTTDTTADGGPVNGPTVSGSLEVA